MSDKIALKLWLQLAKTSALLHAQINARFREEFDQSMTRFDVLSQLARVESKALSVGALSASLIASSGNITRLLDRMQNEGLLDRKASTRDRRAITVHMTPKGADLFDKMARSHALWISAMLNTIPGGEQQILLEKLYDLEKAL